MAVLPISQHQYHLTINDKKYDVFHLDLNARRDIDYVESACYGSQAVPGLMHWQVDAKVAALLPYSLIDAQHPLNVMVQAGPRRFSFRGRIKSIEPTVANYGLPFTRVVIVATGKVRQKVAA